MTVATKPVHRTRLNKNRPGPLGGPLGGPGMADVVKARYSYVFGVCAAPNLYLVHDGDGWDGTYGFVLRRVLEDVFNADPGADPWPTSLIADGQDGALETVAGYVAAFDAAADEVVFDDGSTVAVDDIVAIAV